MPIPGDEVFDAGEPLFRRLEHIHRLLADPEHDVGPHRRSTSSGS